jgi:hypothetical protein
MITSGGKRKPANADRAMGAGRGRRVLMATVCPLWARSQQMHACLTRCRRRGCTCSMMTDAFGSGSCECCPVGGLSVECPLQGVRIRRYRLIEACLHPTHACAAPPPAPTVVLRRRSTCCCSSGSRVTKTPWRPAWSTRPAPSSRPPPSPTPLTGTVTCWPGSVEAGS